MRPFISLSAIPLLAAVFLSAQVVIGPAAAGEKQQSVQPAQSPAPVKAAPGGKHKSMPKNFDDPSNLDCKEEAPKQTS